VDSNNTTHGGSGGIWTISSSFDHFKMFKPPPAFDFQSPELWRDWKTRFERFRIATELDKKREIMQVPVIACACYACMTSVHYIIIVNDVKQEDTFGGGLEQHNTVSSHQCRLCGYTIALATPAPDKSQHQTL
jgi:hypothetical protein